MLILSIIIARKIRWIIVALGVAVTPALPAVAAPKGACAPAVANGDWLQGTLTVEKHEHPNGKIFKSFVLRLDPPVCVRGLEPEDDGPPQDVRGVARIQFAGTFDPALAKRLTGRTAQVRGTFFAAHTAWHIADILVAVDTLKAP